MIDFENLFFRINKISDTNIVNSLHLQEESGELATEILIDEGLIKKEKGKDGIIARLVM